jgi:hypothetical protein
VSGPLSSTSPRSAFELIAISTPAGSFVTYSTVRGFPILEEEGFEQDPQQARGLRLFSVIVPHEAQSSGGTQTGLEADPVAHGSGDPLDSGRETPSSGQLEVFLGDDLFSRAGS